MPPLVGKTLQAGSPVYSAWITWRDAELSLKLGSCTVAAFLPQRFWKGISARLARVHLRFRRSNIARFSSVFERRINMSAADLERDCIASGYEEGIEAIREVLPGGWHPPIKVCGNESLDEALRRNRGAVLWVGEFWHSDLVTKKGLAEAGYQLTQLSTVGHPYSSSRFGSRVLNPIRLLAENRYLTRRVLMVYSKAQPALTALASALRQNGIVTIAATASGTRILEVPMLGGILRLAAGAPMLALRTGAALIPVFTVPDNQGGYTIHIGPDISAVAAAENKERLKLMGIRFASLLEPFVVDHPTQWRGWIEARLQTTGESTPDS
jgi:lauroyl/myristoyl acyltransferase